MGFEKNKLMENFNENNIEHIRSIIQNEKAEGPRIKQAYTMVRVNTSCDVEITKAGRKICVDALLK